jgi:hypothetical protein
MVHGGQVTEHRRFCRNDHSDHRDKRLQLATSVEKMGNFIKILKFTETPFK